MELQKEMEAKGKERSEAQAKISELTEQIQVSKEEQGALAKELDVFKDKEQEHEAQ